MLAMPIRGSATASAAHGKDRWSACAEYTDYNSAVIDLSNYRIVDLSYELVPGERRINGEYLPGEPWYGRSLELQEFFFSTARMHFLQAQTHLGTHYEAPCKYQDGPDVAGTDLTSYLGEAVVCDFSAKAGGEAITGEDFA